MRAHDFARLTALTLAFVASSACNRGPTWDWREHYSVTCEAFQDWGTVSVRAVEDLPSGATVSVPELPELDDTINNSGIYMASASYLSLPVGTQTLTFNATSGEQTASVTCQIERAALPAEVEAVKPTTEPFTRGTVVFDFTPAGGEARPLRTEAAVDDQRRYLLAFKMEQPASIEAGGAALEASDTGVFEVPVEPEIGGVTTLKVRNADGQEASFEITVRETKPFVDEDRQALREGGEAGYAWAAATPETRAEGQELRTLFLDQEFEPLMWIGDPRTLAEVQRIAWTTATEEQVVETCDYGSVDGTEASIDRVRLEAELVLREAKTGAEVARKRVKARPARCPAAADFTVYKQDLTDQGVAFDQRIVGDVSDAAEGWFAKASQK